MKTNIKTFLFACFAFLVCVPQVAFAQSSDSTFRARIIEIQEEGDTYQTLLVHDSDSNEITVQNGNIYTGVTKKFSVGERIVVTEFENLQGEREYVVSDYDRSRGLLYLFIFFVGIVALIGGAWGAMSVVGMAFSFFVIFIFILPQILEGSDAVTTAILGSSLIIPVNFTLSHGLKRKTLIAILSTVITITITGFLANLFVESTHLTGFAAEESSFLLTIAGDTLNFKGILLAGIIISTLGVLDDITISQASIVSELQSANKKLKDIDIFTKAMNVGRDHIASLVNTLILVYTGASLPLLLLFTQSGQSYISALNFEIVSEEVVRTLVGSIGLVLAVPITTFIAVYFDRFNNTIYKNVRKR